MKYCINNDIRIRICDTQTFFVNIKNNTIFNVETSTYLYLKKKLDEGLTSEMLSNSPVQFRAFVMQLKDYHIIGETL